MSQVQPTEPVEPPPVVVRLTPAVDPLRERQIGPVEPIGVALRRICLNSLDKAITGLTDPEVEPNLGIHSARKAFKRVRAIIRLTRDTVGYPAYRQENVVLRDIGRRLAPARDSFVLVQTLDRITGRFEGLLAPDAFAGLRSVLCDRHRDTFGRIAGDRQVMTDIVTGLRTCRRRFAAWPVDGDGPGAVPDRFESIAPGLLRVYRRGQRGMARAREAGTAAAYHEWRKRAKYLRYQMEALEPLWPGVVGSLALALDELGEVLGAEHDLDQLEQVVSREPFAPLPADAALVLRALIGEERKVLRTAARAGGTRIYAEGPDEFVRRLAAYWAAAGRP
jgi:CHAD domain-containing protein